jgi:uncharacterized OsmC-like protein
MNAIATAITDTRAFLQERPDRGSTVDTPVTATLESGLRCSFRDGDVETGATDLPVRLGGSASAPSPGHYVRGAIAACAATAIAMRAAEIGVEIESVSVTAATTSDVPAFLGLHDGMVGFLGLEVTIDISAPGSSSRQIDELIEYALAHAPVSQSIEHPVPTTVRHNISSQALLAAGLPSLRAARGHPA